MKDYSNELYYHIKTYLEKNQWELTESIIEGKLHTTVKLKSEIAYINLLIDVHESNYQVYAYLHTTIPTELRQIVAEKINEVNCALTFGHFEYSQEGELRYRYVIACENNLPSEQTLHNSLHIPSYTVDFYGPKILSVMQ